MTRLHFLVVGYYGHSNQGDEQYKITIEYLLTFLFPECQIEFVDCDSIQDLYIPHETVVLLGGGDVLNPYFVDKLHRKFPLLEGNIRSNRIIALSVGIPYNNIFTDPVQRHKLSIFEAIFLRTRQDLPLLLMENAETFLGDRVYYLPDTSCLLFDALAPVRPNVRFLEYLKPAIDSKRRIVGVSLCRHIYHPDRPYRDNYTRIVNELAFIVYHLVKEGFYVVLVPFNTKMDPSAPHLNKENDTLIQEDVWRLLSDTTKKYVMNIRFELSTKEMMILYTKFYACIPMRFHATMFSIYHHVPMLPLYTTKKIRNLLLDIDYPYQMPLITGALDLPVGLDRALFMKRFRDLVRNHDTVTWHLKHANGMLKQSLMGQYMTLKNVIVSGQSNVCDFIPEITTEQPVESIETPDVLSDISLDVLASTTYSTSLTDDAEEIDSSGNAIIQLVYDKLQEFAVENGISDFRLLQDDELRQVAVSVVSYYLTGSIDSQYNHGMITKMFDSEYNFRKEWCWVMRDHEGKQSVKQALDYNDQIIGGQRDIRSLNSNVHFNIDYIDQEDRTGVHRSGWRFVYDHLKPYSDSCSNLLVDLYVDRTFHWKRNVFKYTGVIPYTRPWVGFIHHTFDTTFSQYNNKRLLENQEFRESLKYCKCLIVLSQTLQHQLSTALQTTVPPVGNPIPVFHMTHPTELNVRGFSYSAFLDNQDKCILHIGGWLRNIFTFYQMELMNSYDFIEPLTSASHEESSKKKIGWSDCLNCCSPKAASVSSTVENAITSIRKGSLRKVVIKGKYMNNYFPTDQDSSQIVQETDGSPSVISSPKCSRGGHTKNNFELHIQAYIQNIYKTTTVVSFLENDVYDDLLTKNIVFLHLVDGSAINTLLECFVRNTPMIINRHPAVVEVLGEEYPLYYTLDASIGNTQPQPSVSQLLSHPCCVWDAHCYLAKMDKSRYDVGMFVDKFLEIIRTVST